MTVRVAVVAEACEFPEACNPYELWRTILHGRRCFRQIPSQRLITSDYVGNASNPDSIYSIEAALLEGYHFNREIFRVPNSSFIRTDMAHWLALDVATRALASLDADGVAAERDGIAVIVANTLTGEFSRANQLRYRWPYVERLIRSVGSSHLAAPEVDDLLRALEIAYKAPFPLPDEDSLAGSLSNTIAGRIANHHGLRGGAHTVDGACASSLVAVVSACDRLAMGDVGCVVVGAVDLSLDPFELVGFSRNNALARSLMRVFDDQSDGFWPGEGCGFLVLANEDVVERRGWPVLGWICGAAMSTDGEGALTRPTMEGQLLAAQRAWSRAGLNPFDADYFEAHGTGTPTGDPIELASLARLIGSAPPLGPIPVGSIKANIGHTKAAAGMAGLLKAIAICRERVLPATTGCLSPHKVLQGEIGKRVNVREQAARVTHPRPITVGVNSFGFGGVNCHVVVQGADSKSGHDIPSIEMPRTESTEFTDELFLLDAPSRDSLAELLRKLEGRAKTISRAQLVDLSKSLVTGNDEPSWRACLVVSTPQELGTVSADVRASLNSRLNERRHFSDRWCWSEPCKNSPRIALLFPGQGLPLQPRLHPWVARFPFLTEIARRAQHLTQQNLSDTSVIQPLLAEIALAGLALLDVFGIEPERVLGHSFGEFPALHAAGRISQESLRSLATARGQCMKDHSPSGAMLAVHVKRGVALKLASTHDVDLACENGPNRHVLSGDRSRIEAVAKVCIEQGIASEMLPVTQAFHSRLMLAARNAFAPHLSVVSWQPALLKVVSSVTGVELSDNDCLTDLLTNQLVQPVKFVDALNALGNVDLIVEVGASANLGSLVDAGCPGHALSLSIFGDSLTPLLLTLGAVWVHGGNVNCQPLYDGRLLRPCHIDDEPMFLANPCGAPANSDAQQNTSTPITDIGLPQSDVTAPIGGTVLDTLRRVVAEVTGLRVSGLDGHLRMLADLHLNSIHARHAVALAAKRIGLERLPFDLAHIANASLEEVAAYLEGLRREISVDEDIPPSEGTPWLRLLSHQWVDSSTPIILPETWSHTFFLQDPLSLLSETCRSVLTISKEDDARSAILVFPVEESAEIWRALLRMAQRLLAPSGLQGLLVLQGAHLANGFLRSVSAELPRRRICVVEYERLDMASLRAAIAEFDHIERGYSEIRLRGGKQQRRAMTPADIPSTSRPWVPTSSAVVIVTGGASGIGAVTALALLHRQTCRLAIIGRSPAEAEGVINALLMLRGIGSNVKYFCADLSDKVMARAVFNTIESDMGPVTAIFHAAGINRPMGIGVLSSDEIEATLANKVTSLENLLEYIPENQLELVVGYGSIIGELGLAGEAHYALANEWLNRLLARYAHATPHCRVVPICWSAWREVGMAARMEGVLDGLHSSGTRALENDEAIAALNRLLYASPATPVVVSGRYGRSIDPGTDLRLLQKYRYLERPRIFYPGIELVVDAQVCSDSDLYLQDHAPFGVPIFPLVCALEAMISAAQCLCGKVNLPRIIELRVGEAISCAIGQRFLIRTSLVVLEDSSLLASIRSETTGFEMAHFTARLSWSNGFYAEGNPLKATDMLPAAELLYQGLCFHGPRFQRLSKVTTLSATYCQVHSHPGEYMNWYGPLLPQSFATGDPGLRDSFLHALQLCIPHQIVLPVAVASIQIGRLESDREYVISAHQTSSNGQTFVFDIEICNTTGEVVERWTGVELLQVSGHMPSDARGKLSPHLLSPLIARVATDALHGRDVSAGMVVGQSNDVASECALAKALGRSIKLQRLPNGALTIDGHHVSTSHASGITVALACSEERVAIDLQFASEYNLDEWRLMLGEERFRFTIKLSEQETLPLHQALLIAWTMSECLIKLGYMNWPLACASFTRIESALTGPILVFDCGLLRLAATSLMIANIPGHATFAIALESRTQSLLPKLETKKLPFEAKTRGIS